MEAPPWGLPDVTKTFALFKREGKGIAFGVLAHCLGPQGRAVACSCKELDEVSSGWPGCLKAGEAPVLPMQEAPKFTMGQKVTVHVPPTVVTALEDKGGHWLAPSIMLS